MRLQSPLLLAALVTVAGNCWVCPEVGLAPDGLMVTPIAGRGELVTRAVPLTKGLAELVAVIVTVAVEVTFAGEVYSPL